MYHLQQTREAYFVSISLCWVGFFHPLEEGGKKQQILGHPLETWMDTIRSWSETLDDDIVRLK